MPGAGRVRRWRRRFLVLVLVMIVLAGASAMTTPGDEVQQQQEEDTMLTALAAMCAAGLGSDPGAAAAPPCPGQPGTQPGVGGLAVASAECRQDGSTLPPDMGNITARMRAVMEALVGCFGRGRYGFGCWRGGTSGEHPLGRACDFMMSDGTMPDAYHLEQGWRMANLLVQQADAWGIMYVIWQDQIWHTSRRSEGWREYTCLDSPCNLTEDHYDHVHVSVDP